MTDPLGDYPMPFSVPHNHGTLGAYGFVIPPEYRMPGGMQTASVILPPGMSMITFSWDGAESVRYRVERKINGVWTAMGYHVVIEAGVAGTPRTSDPVSVVSAGPGQTAVYIQTVTQQSQATIDVGATASVDVATIPPK